MDELTARIAARALAWQQWPYGVEPEVSDE